VLIRHIARNDAVEFKAKGGNAALIKIEKAEVNQVAETLST